MESAIGARRVDASPVSVDNAAMDDPRLFTLKRAFAGCARLQVLAWTDNGPTIVVQRSSGGWAEQTVGWPSAEASVVPLDAFAAATRRWVDSLDTATFDEMFPHDVFVTGLLA